MTEIKYNSAFLRNLPDLPPGMLRLMNLSGVLRDVPEDASQHYTDNKWRVIAADQTEWLRFIFDSREWDRTKYELTFYDREFLREIGVGTWNHDRRELTEAQ